jgi:hypothetical protein
MSPVRNFVSHIGFFGISNRVKNVFIFLVRFYQFSSLIPSACRFYPTCSAYALESIEKLGILKGLIKTFLRIGRCHPFSKGGYDPIG